MKWKLLFLSFLFLSCEVRGQFRQVTGIVLDGRDITLLPGVQVKGGMDTDTATTGPQGKFAIRIPDQRESLTFQIPGYGPVQKTLSAGQHFTTVFLYPDHPRDQSPARPPGSLIQGSSDHHVFGMPVSIKTHQDETYEQVSENYFEKASQYPFSSFILNANDASFCNVRRFIMSKQPPPKEAVRIEEMVNHLPFSYGMDSLSLEPLSFHSMVTRCPWHAGHWLMRLAVQAKKMPSDTLVPNNLVLLVDVSGSMEAPNKLPLLKKAFQVLVDQMDSLDRIAIVVYSGNVSVALPSTPADQRSKIKDVIDNLSAGGSTAGKAGIELAFKLAREHFIAGGNNRVIIATDGDFNVGNSSDADMRQLIMRYHDWGIYLTCIGVGMGNYKDSKLETLAEWGQGNFAYIDNTAEALRIFSPGEYKKILVTFVRDARIKSIFNPEIVKSYRLIGYESRVNGSRDSLGSQLPGGEIGYGQSITAFYELEPVAGLSSPADPQQQGTASQPKDENGGDLATVALQYETINDGSMHLIMHQVPDRVITYGQTDPQLKFAAAVTLFGMLLQHSDYAGEGSYALVGKLIRELKGKSYKDERKAFEKLVQKASELKTPLAPQ